MSDEKLRKEIEEFLGDNYCCELKEECESGVRIRCTEYEQREKLLYSFAENKNIEIARLKGEASKGKDRLDRAIWLIQNIIRVTWGEGWGYSLGWKVEAEKFLKELGEENDRKRLLF